MKKLFLFIAAALVSTGMWAAASTTTDGKYATGTVDFSEIGTLTAATTYWNNGVKFYSGNSTEINANTSAWSEKISIPAYISNKTASNADGKGKWGSNGAGKQYTMSGFACSQHTIGIHVNQACTLTVVVNKNRQSDTDDAGITASLDATAYGTAWTSSTYKAAGTALTVTSARADKTNAPGRYTLTIVVTNANLTDGEAVVKMFNGSSGSGADKLFCWESITVTAAPATNYNVTIDPNGGAYTPTPEGWTLSEGVYTKSVAAGSFNVPDGLANSGYDLTGWKDGQGNSITLPITLSKDTTLVAQWTEHAVSSDATLSALSLAGYTFKETFDPATTAYTVTLPFYESAPATSAVTATANDANASVGTVTYDSENTKYSVTVTAEDKTTTKTYTITLNWADTPAASSSINIEQLVLDNGKSYDIGSALTAANIAYVEKDALDSLLIGDSKNKKTDCNEAYLGLKFKKSTSKVTIIVPSNQSLNVKFGAITSGSNLTVSVNGATPAAPSLANNVYTLAASEGVKEVVFALGGAKTVVFKQIMVNEAVATVRPFEATVAATTNGTASVDLAKYAKGEEVTVNTDPEDGYILYSIVVTGYNDDGTALNVEVAEGKFTMPGSPVNIAVTFAADPSGVENTEAGVKAVKVLKNGVLFIEKNGKVYNAQGNIVK